MSTAHLSPEISLSDAMSTVALRLRTMQPEQLDSIMSETSTMIRSADPKEVAIGALLRMQVLNAIHDGEWA